MSSRIASLIASIVMPVLVLSGCDRSPASPSPAASPAEQYQVTTVSFTSDAQDYVGQGRSQTFTLQNSTFTANVGNNGGILSVVIRPLSAPTPVWTLIVDAAGESQITPGTYQTYRDFGSGRWTVAFGGDGRGCGSITGRVVVHSFDFIPVNQALKSFRASFEQHCEGAAPVLKGEVALLADPWR